MSRTFVVGLDGASWKLLDPWIDDGALPNLESLRSEGSWAANQSCLPPVTFPNWKCYSSGKNPGGFGVFWFEYIDLETGEITIPNRHDFKTAELWHYLNDEGLSAGVVNMPTMYPPPEIDGYVICGGPDAVEGEYRSISSGYTFPAEFESVLSDRFDYRVHPDPLLSSNEEYGAEVDAILDLLEKRFEVALYLFEKEGLDFVHVTLFYLNVLQHFFWNGEPTKRAWELVDDWIGQLRQLEDTNLVLMSDHGCAPTTTEFYINEWLKENGYLNTHRTFEDYLTTLGINRESVLALAKRLGIVDPLAKIVPERIQQLVPQSAGTKRERKLEKIVLPETKAVASGQGPVYLNPDYDIETVQDLLIEELTSITTHNGERLFTDVHPRERVYDGPYVEDAPEIIVEMRSGVHVNDGLGGGEIMTQPDRWAAENTRSGIFVASGPDFESAGDLGTIEITDIMPTVLASFGINTPTDIHGKALPIVHEEVSTRDPIRLSQEDRTQSGSTVEDRLKQLGYME
jgi:predicted AlkP superfamily phosphohydrolase/phosphomutase